jgi:cbb3-type cytochrome oxidase subunit 3
MKIHPATRTFWTVYLVLLLVACIVGVLRF